MSLVATILAFALAAWGLLASALNRAPDRAQFFGTVALTLAIAAFIVVKLSGQGQAGVTFFGYAATAVLLPPAAWALARLEPTRYGSLIVGVAALIVPVLVLRMGQVWVVS